MKKNIFPYIIFIFAFVGFISLRIFAGNYVNITKPSEKISDVATESAKTVTSVTPTPETDIISDTPATSTPTPAPESGIINDPWHGDFTPVKQFVGELPRIVCWGDSLTESTNKKIAYPDVLRKISGCEVLNYGVSSETTSMIAMREGGVKVTLNSTVIPKACELIPVFLNSEDDSPIYLLDYGEAGINPCTIGTIQGKLVQLNGAYYFERLTPGERISIDQGTQLKPFGLTDAKDDDVLVIFTGTNDMPTLESIYSIIDTQQAMLKAANCNRYIIIGLTYAAGIPEIDGVNEVLANEYGDNFLDIRSYMLNYGLEDAGITPTKTDLRNIQGGEIPDSLRSDYVHGNKAFYELLAQQVYRKMQYLGYLPLDNNEITSPN